MARHRLQNDINPANIAVSKSVTTSEYVIEGGSYRVCDLPVRMRPREEIDRLGVEHVSDDVLLAVILRSGVRGANVVDVARHLLKQYGSLTGIASTSREELAQVRGMGKVKAQVLLSALELARRLSEECMPRRCRIRTPEDAVMLLRDKAKTLSNEVFWVILLDSKNYIKGNAIEITRGLLDASLVHPREVFREAIRRATAAVVLVHNHPSGDPSPSVEDIRITKQLVEAGRIVDIKVLDHIILGKRGECDVSDFISMRESGVVEFT
ncbi:MAG: DNA repair protein RadC [Kiritimatiellae bacterium]|nr:DNA repair protein RadC [Kiritimatiellia bacterium]MDD5522153.1 DNA repair protein RadC [Kiritimatiellia bacterium]